MTELAPGGDGVICIHSLIYAIYRGLLQTICVQATCKKPMILVLSRSSSAVGDAQEQENPCPRFVMLITLIALLSQSSVIEMRNIPTYLRSVSILTRTLAVRSFPPRLVVSRRDVSSTGEGKTILDL